MEAHLENKNSAIDKHLASIEDLKLEILKLMRERDDSVSQVEELTKQNTSLKSTKESLSFQNEESVSRYKKEKEDAEKQIKKIEDEK